MANVMWEDIEDEDSTLHIQGDCKNRVWTYQVESWGSPLTSRVRRALTSSLRRVDQTKVELDGGW
jgi:hypothetical protein